MKKKRGVVRKTKRDLTPFFSIVAILIIVVIVFIVLNQPSPTETQEELDKTTGGVVICGQDFQCGVYDQVCPEDYGAKCKVKDIDCEVEQ